MNVSSCVAVMGDDASQSKVVGGEKSGSMMDNQVLDHASYTIAPILRIGSTQQFIQQEQDRTTLGEIEDGTHPRYLREEPGFAFLAESWRRHTGRQLELRQP